jgi:hypothetical protein
MVVQPRDERFDRRRERELDAFVVVARASILSHEHARRFDAAGARGVRPRRTSPFHRALPHRGLQIVDVDSARCSKYNRRVSARGCSRDELCKVWSREFPGHLLL